MLVFLALTIQQDAIDNVGMVIENLGSNDSVVDGILSQRMASCLKTIDHFLQQSKNICFILCTCRKITKNIWIIKASADLIETMANNLRISNANTTSSADNTLTNLGLDSFGSVEIKQLFEQKYSVALANSTINYQIFKRN